MSREEEIERRQQVIFDQQKILEERVRNLEKIMMAHLENHTFIHNWDHAARAQQEIGEGLRD